MLDQIAIENMRKHFSNVHPLMFHRSLEKAKSNGELFDILDTIPNTFPLIWCDKTNRWISSDLYLSNEFADLQINKKKE